MTWARALESAAAGVAVGARNGSTVRTTSPRSSRSVHPPTMNCDPRAVEEYRASPAPLETLVVERQCAAAAPVGPPTNQPAG